MLPMLPLLAPVTNQKGNLHLKAATGQEEAWVETELVYLLTVFKFVHVSPCNFNIGLMFSESTCIYLYIHRYRYVSVDIDT